MGARTFAMHGLSHGLSLALQFSLSCVLVAVCTLSVQLAVLAWVRVFRKSPKLALAPLGEHELPHVLVQLPVCNEGLLAVRVTEAAARMDWPKDRLTVQLLDDGDGEGHAALARDAIATAPEGVKLEILRRGTRTGFKAGNLAFGLKHSEAPYVAIFDADFVPPPDFLRRTVPALVADPGLAFVQARWAHANRNANWLTRVQGLLLDSHFAVEQEARFRAGLPISFNGTAGVWSRTAIEEGGGWTGDTLTEDLDLSMRCMMQGWRAGMIPDLTVPGELPQTAAAWRAQQARWTKGHAQCARKLLPSVWMSGMPLWKKAAMTLQMCQFAFYMLAFASAAISLVLMYMGVVYYSGVALLGLIVTLLGLASSIGYLYLGQRMLGQHYEPRLYPGAAAGGGISIRPDPGQHPGHLRSFLQHQDGFQPHHPGGRNSCRRLARRAGTGRGPAPAGVRLRRIQLERGVLFLRRVRPGFDRSHGSVRHRPAGAPAHHARRVSPKSGREQFKSNLN